MWNWNKKQYPLDSAHIHLQTFFLRLEMDLYMGVLCKGYGTGMEKQMILITGGAFQGKKAYTKETFSLEEDDFADGGSCSWDAVYESRGIFHFHEYIRRCLEAGRDISTLTEEILLQNPEIVIVVNELGSGVVPVDAFDREYRETTGRICCALAKKAREVHRVICGIGTVIKHG